jgi:hypothetical protein
MAMPESKKYLVVMLTVAGALLAALWVFTSEGRLAFADDDFGIRKAKLELIDQCDVGKVVVLGDSRAAMGFTPQVLGPNVTNLAFAGTTPIEGSFLVRRMLRCPHRPRLIVVSYSPFQFEHANWLWVSSARDGLLGYADLEDIRRRERILSPGFLYRDSFGEEPPGRIKNWLYSVHFPAYDFASLIHSGAIGRWRSNAIQYAQTKAQQGYHAVRPAQKCALAPPRDEQEPTFNPQAIIDTYYKEMLDTLRSHDIQILVIQTPISEIESQALTPAFKQQFAHYMTSRSEGHYVAPSMSQLFPVVDNCDFQDDVHLSTKGATAFSSKVLAELRRLEPAAIDDSVRAAKNLR